VHGLCLFLPATAFPFQRKMAEGLHVPLAVLAAYALIGLARRVGGVVGGWATAARYRQAGPTWSVRCDHACRRQDLVPWLTLLGVLLLAPSNLLFVSGTLAALRDNNAGKWSVAMPPFWLPTAESEALDWLAANLPDDAVVGCLPYVGSYIPGRCGRTVYCGHWAETIGFRDKLVALSKFYRDPGKAADKVAFLRERGDHASLLRRMGVWPRRRAATRNSRFGADLTRRTVSGAEPEAVIFRLRAVGEPLPAPAAPAPVTPSLAAGARCARRPDRVSGRAVSSRRRPGRRPGLNLGSASCARRRWVD